MLVISSSDYALSAAVPLLPGGVICCRAPLVAEASSVGPHSYAILMVDRKPRTKLWKDLETQFSIVE